jgi:hypothetical protein
MSPIEQAIEAMELAQRMVDWCRNLHPQQLGQADHEADAQIDAALAALRSMPEPVHQFRVPNTCTWFDGHADHTDGGGPYEERTLYATPHTAPVPLSDAEIQQMWDAHEKRAWDKTLINPIVFARAIERAVLGRGGEKL